jgi:CDP-diacylglycerol--glycerol-3-phosphate 3-phosphatidyltransferase
MARAGWLAALGLTLLRLALAPAALLLLRAGAPGAVFAAILVTGFLSDVFDGVVARRCGVATAMLRRLDSSVDTVFYLAIAYAVYRLHPDPLRALAWPIAIVLGGEALNYVAAYALFRREAGYHAWSAKVWGALLFSSLLLLLAGGNAILLPVALTAGIVAQADTLAITLSLPAWQPDVRGVGHALRLRRTWLDRRARSVV